MGDNIQQNNSESMFNYIQKLTKTPLLTSNEEILVTTAVKIGNEKAKNRLIEANMRLVINIAKTYQNKTILLEDLIQEGTLGLIQAAERFDPSKGFKFSTYATHWIKQAIGRAIDYKSKSIRLPAHVSQTLRRIEKVRSTYISTNEIEPTLEQLSDILGIPEKKLFNLLQSAQDILSLDAPIHDSDMTIKGNLVCRNITNNPDNAIELDERIKNLENIIAMLNETEQKIIRHRFDIQVNHNDSFDKTQMSQERIRQIEIQALKKLRLLVDDQQILF